MKKSILYRLFGVGAIPKNVRAVLEAEGIVVCDEGMSGRLITRDVKGPGKRYLNRSEGFLGCLVVTRKRIACFSFRKRQINISVDGPNTSGLYVDTPHETGLTLAFESSFFRRDWEGVMAFRFNTGKAPRFRDALLSFGAQSGTPTTDG